MKTAEPKDGDYLMCLSYIPLMYHSAAGVFYDKSVFEAFSDRIEKGRALCPAKGCLWMESGGEIAPVFLLDRGKDILNHMTVWSEGEPAKWFTVDIAVSDNSYIICLYPKLSMNANRIAKAYKTRTGKDMPKSSLEFVCAPLHFVSASLGLMTEVRTRFGNLCHLGLLDMAKYDPDDPLHTRMEDVDFIGPLAIRWDPEETREFLGGLLDQVDT
jgi:hypothetical protein